MQLAAEAHSTAHHVRDEFNAYRIEQAKRNRDVVQLISRVDSRVTALANQLTGWRGEQKGEAKAQRRLFTVMALLLGALAAVEPLIHLAKLIGSR